jgi:hypothetical protein
MQNPETIPLKPFWGFNPISREVRLFGAHDRLPEGWTDLGNAPDLVSARIKQELIPTDVVGVPQVCFITGCDQIPTFAVETEFTEILLWLLGALFIGFLIISRGK